MYFSQFIGVDISKDTLDAAVYPQKGLMLMMSWLKRRGIKASEMVICAEHTGVYTN